MELEKASKPKPKRACNYYQLAHAMFILFYMVASAVAWKFFGSEAAFTVFMVGSLLDVVSGLYFNLTGKF